MGAFELNDIARTSETNSEELHERQGHKEKHDVCNDSNLDPNRIREENIIALKVYDSCRTQECLTPSDLGPARAAECVIVGEFTINEGDVIKPPHEAAAVTIDRLRIKKIMIIEKEPNSFRRGFWDIDLKYVFEYRLIFREADGCIIGSVKANSIFNKKVTLFGSEGSDLFVSTDLFNSHHESATLNADPFVAVEAKAVALEAELRYSNNKKNKDQCCGHESQGRACEVDVTIGLFTIIKLFRIVDLSVQSRGFSIPDKCEEVISVDPCEYFDSLSFPMDIFAPPQKPEFFAGITGDIPNTDNKENRHGCSCNKKHKQKELDK